jgi:hypothetical protein
MGIGAVHDDDATHSDLTIDGDEAAEESVIEHKNGVLTNPVPGRAEMMSFEHSKYGLNTFNISITVLTPEVAARCCPAELESALS